MKIPVLIAANHLLNEEKLKIGNKIVIEYDDNEGFIISISNNSKIFINREYDITIIEIKEDNYQFNKLIFMDIDEDIFKSKDFLIDNFNKKKAYLLKYVPSDNCNEPNEKSKSIIKKNIEEFTKDKKYKIEEGRIIVKEDEYNIIHNIPTGPGAGGGPIISHNKFKVIGYHIGKMKNSYSEYKGIGHLLKLPILDFIKQYYS